MMYIFARNMNIMMVLEKSLKRSLNCKESNQSILKEINPEYSLKGLMLKLKLQYFGLLMWRTNTLEDTDAGKNWRQEEKGLTEDEMVGWHHWFNGHEFEQTLRVCKEQGSLACCSPWGCKELNTTEQQLDLIPWAPDGMLNHMAYLRMRCTH